jgi:hypothetical protein
VTHTNYTEIMGLGRLDVDSFRRLSRELSEVALPALGRCAERSSRNGTYTGPVLAVRSGVAALPDAFLDQVAAEVRSDRALAAGLNLARIMPKLVAVLKLANHLAQTAMTDGPPVRRNPPAPAKPARCDVCGRPALGGRGSYCKPCSSSWYDYRVRNSNDRVGFRMWRRENLAELASARVPGL